ncbi:PQQ-binding-like beta-propeller repeat protein [Actinotalea sp. BY-33]|uniref:PQQ-binding-like beta-propeller repeat protein n=1 Tax=Actinotalea soli TaxID=2819234 RepID=A0A939RSB0_9CELL|nr:PQQ-binding-like beta-propeller repeat protein [Actinotalea soli]MBO1750682.1 PQQ-binding-like beta-propeller repeat protein [Actinotalea soli]
MTPRRRRGRDDEVEVVLDVDAEEAALEPGRPASPGARRRRWITAGAVAALALAVGTVNVVDARRAEARLDALREMPGVHAGLDEPLREVWQAQGWVITETADSLVLLDEATGRLSALDPHSGGERWHDEGPGEPWRTDCAPTRDTADPVLVCVRFVLPGDRGADGDLRVDGEAKAVRLVALDLETGETLQETVLDGERIVLQPVDEDVVVATGTEDGYLEVRRWQPLTGEVTWSYRSESPVLGPAASSVRSVTSDLEHLEIRGSRTVTISLETGEEVEARELDLGAGAGMAYEVPLPEGRTFLWRESSAQDGSGAEGVVTAADGTELYTVPGTVDAPAVDDGSAPAVLAVHAVQDGSLLGVDAATGEHLWEAPGSRWVLARIDGKVVAAGLDAHGQDITSAIDLRTGEVLWEVGARVSTVTDGRRVLVVPSGGGPRVTALSVADGSEAWSIPLPSGQGWISTVGEAVVVRTDDGLVGLG